MEWCFQRSQPASDAVIVAVTADELHGDGEEGIHTMAAVTKCIEWTDGRTQVLTTVGPAPATV